MNGEGYRQPFRLPAPPPATAPPVTDLTPPSITMTSPTDGASFAIGSAVSVAYSLYDLAGIASHKLFVNGVQVTPTTTGEDAYSYNIASLASGVTTIKVEAADPAGNVTTLQRTITGTTAAASISKVVAGSVDDFFTGSSAGSVTSTTDYMGWQGNHPYYTGNRFLTVGLKKRQRVTSALWKPVAYGYHNGTQVVPGVAGVNPGVTVRIWGVLGKNPTNPLNPTVAETGYLKTTAFVDWAPTEWANGVRYTSPDLSAIVQELVNQDTWAEGDSVLLLVGPVVLSGITSWLREWAFDRTSTPKGSEFTIEAATDFVASTSNKLTWAPPTLTTPTTVTFPSSGVLNLDVTKDYIIDAGNAPHTKALAVNGGRNWVCYGLEVDIPVQPRGRSIGGVMYSEISPRRALKIAGHTGIAHLEGFHFYGADFSEGIQIYSPNGVVQIQNGRMDGMHAQDQVGFVDQHPDLIQTAGSVKELRIDKLTGDTDYQGFLLQPDNNTGPHGPTIIKRTNIKGQPTSRYLFWMNNRTGWKTVSLSDFYCDIPPERTLGFGKSVYPDTGFTAPNTALIETVVGRERASWPNMLEPVVTGYVIEGAPPAGDFVLASQVGNGYASPGYL